MMEHVCVVLVGRGVACMGLGEPRGGLLAHALTMRPCCAADGHACNWVGVWRRLQLLSVPAGGGTDAAKLRLFRAYYACVDRVHVSGRDRGLRLLVEKLDFE